MSGVGTETALETQLLQIVADLNDGCVAYEKEIATLRDRVRVLEEQVASLQMAASRGIPR